MKKRTGILIVLAVLLLFALTGCANSAQTVKLGTGNAGGAYYAYGTALGQEIEKQTDLTVIVVETSGSQGNLDLLKSNMVDFAIVQTGTLFAALDQTQEAADAQQTDSALTVGGSVEDLSAIAGLYTEVCQIVVREDSGITKVQDLMGKRVSIGEEGSGVTLNAEQILFSYGIPLDRIEASRYSLSESIDALKRNEIDAFFFTADAPTPAITELAEDISIRLLPLNRHCIDQLKSLYTTYTECIIPGGTYPGQEVDVRTIGENCILLASSSVSAETGKKVTAALFDSKKALESEFGKDTDFDFESATQDIPIGFNAGAAEYYEENGIHVTVAEPVETNNIQSFSFDMYQTLAIAVGILFLGAFVRKKVKPLETFCIPMPVVGGLIFAIASMILYSVNIVEFSFDETIKNICMIIFFTTVGFQANVRVLKSGGVDMLKFLALVAILIILQNSAAVGASSALGIDLKVGMCTGSIPMVGGHGTAGAFGPVLEGLGLPSATTLATAAATFGLVAGSLMGGPVGRSLIRKNHLTSSDIGADVPAAAKDEKFSFAGYAPAAYQIAIAMGIGTIVSWALSLTGMNFPVYIGSMIVAAVMRNASEIKGVWKTPMPEIGNIGDLCLSLYLGIAMITLKLWQLADLALPLMALLGIQVILMFIFAYFIVFRVMGRNYDAAVLASGTCGFGMGATPNAMANMQAITDQFGPSVKAFIIIPIIGSMLADFINSLVITFFINMV